MKRHLYLLVLTICLGGFLLGGCNETSQRPQTNSLPNADIQQSSLDRDRSPAISQDDLDTHILDNQIFTLDFYHQLLTKPDLSGKNILISPLSIRTAFCQAYAGARGITETEIANVMPYSLGQDGTHRAANRLALELESRNDPGNAALELQPIILETVNAFWGRKGDTFQPDYLDLLAVNYGAGIYTLDFLTEPENSRLIINDWVAGRTRDRIKDLLPNGSIGPSTVAVLTNAVYFKAPWMLPFIEEFTESGKFKLLDGGEVDAEMMQATDFYYYTEEPGYQALEVPFRKEELGMVFLLPTDGDFAAFESELTTEKLNSITDALEYISGTVKLPKFTFKSKFKLRTILKQMGMVAPFGGSADFTGMYAPGGIYIDEAYHDTFIAVDESGAEAAGATAIVFREVSIPHPEYQFTADRPFLIFIRDRVTGAILFMGRVVDPS
jgi:serine protease inhibitor